LEVIWLPGGLTPGYKTIADFRKDNPKALKAAGRDFARLCQSLDLYGGETVAVDGSFFSGDASKASIDTAAGLDKGVARVEKQIEAYLAELDAADRRDDEPPAQDPALPGKLARLRERQADLQARRQALADRGGGQLSRTGPDARLLSKRGATVAGYNVQIAVDAQHKRLVCAEATQDGNDSQQLAPMAQQAQDFLGVETLDVLADSGHYHQEHLKTCEDRGITAFVAIPDRQRPQREAGRHTRDDFRHHAEPDHYTCPAGQTLRRQGQQNKDGKRLHHYAARARDCQSCPLKARCLPPKTPYRQLYRWEHEAVVERHRQRMKTHRRDKMRQRAALAEHPFGTLKLWFGWTHFLVRGLAKVQGELGLMTLGYNLRRAISLLGVATLIDRCRARALPA
jgi:hypothetical protein